MTEDGGWMASPNLMDTHLSKLQEMLKDREAWCVVVQAVSESDTTEQLKNKVCHSFSSKEQVSKFPGYSRHP